MEITILEDEKRAKDAIGRQYDIEGLELTRPGGVKVFYAPDDPFYRKVIVKNTTHQAWLLPTGKLIIT